MKKKVIMQLLMTMSLMLLFILSSCVSSREISNSVTNISNVSDAQNNISKNPNGVNASAIDFGNNPSYIAAINFCKKNPEKLLCAKDGKTYFNDCDLTKNSQKLDYVGDCVTTNEKIGLTNCENNHDYVCASSGDTYENDCLVKLDNLTVVHIGACSNSGDNSSVVSNNSCASLPKTFACGFSPKVGKNMTYLNGCYAIAAGLQNITEGKCK